MYTQPNEQTHRRRAPAGTKGFALVLDDYEARGGDGFVHWAAYTSLRTRRGLCRTPAPSKVT
jgi:hypothetical protein